MSKPKNTELLRFVANPRRASKLCRRGEEIDWDQTKRCWVWLLSSNEATNERN